MIFKLSVIPFLFSPMSQNESVDKSQLDIHSYVNYANAPVSSMQSCGFIVEGFTLCDSSFIQNNIVI